MIKFFKECADRRARRYQLIALAGYMSIHPELTEADIKEITKRILTTTNIDGE